ncbi:MAG TPA: hypothetical protein VK559_07890 [Ferruginibacter sp.]|nr:hypothetical protein [Ferruginibacter sp.]
MKYYLIPLCVFLFSGCIATKPDLPVRGIYPAVYTYKSSKSFEDVWSNVIDVFAQKGLPIKIIDKSSGLIVSESILMSATNELKTLKLKDSTDYVVIPKKYNASQNKYSALANIPVRGEWNVRIKKTDSCTLINVNIVNIEERYTNPQNGVVQWENVAGFKSTGIFETTIADLIK